MAAKEVAYDCPRCGAPLPLPAQDGFATCDYCGTRTAISSLVPAQRPLASAPVAAFPPSEPPPESTEDDFGGRSGSYAVRVVAVIVAVAIAVAALAAFSATQPSSPSSSPSVPHCSVAINPSATSGPAPFTATFTANITTPPGDFTNEPMWQFGPFPSGIDLNFTYGSTVTHTWNSEGSFGVHVTVPDSSGQGCYSTMSVTVT